jgi:hypothetical protein
LQLDKQTEFTARKIFINEQKDWEVLSLQRKLDKVSKESGAKTAAMLKVR